MNDAAVLAIEKLPPLLERIAEALEAINAKMTFPAPAPAAPPTNQYPYGYPVVPISPWDMGLPGTWCKTP